MRPSWFVYCVLTEGVFRFKAVLAQDGRSQTEDDDQSGEDDGGDKGMFFTTMWPLLMILIAGGILIAVIVIACKRCRPTIKRRHRRASEGDTGTTHQQPVTGADDGSNPLDTVWTVEGTGHSDHLPPPSIHLKPPPYCEAPPSYEDIKLTWLQAKSDCDASAPFDDEGNTIYRQQGNPPRASAPPDAVAGRETNLARNNSPELSHTSDAPVDVSRASDVSASVGTTPNNGSDDVRHSDDTSTNNEPRFFGEAGSDNVTFAADTETTIQ